MTDREILRELAKKVKIYSELPIMAERRELWYKHNACQSTKPIILVLPEGSWSELLPPDKVLQCQDPLLRNFELSLRRQIFTHEEIDDDNVIEPILNVNWDFKIGDFGVPYIQHFGENRGSFTWEPPIKNIHEEIGRLKHRSLSIDHSKSDDNLAVAQDVLGDILNVRRRGNHWWTMGLTIFIIELIGLEGLMMMMFDDPDGVHELMAWMRDEHMQMLDWYEHNELLYLNNENDTIGSGAIGYSHQLPTSVDGKIRISDLWGLGESQETVGISPQMFAEFIFPYQVPLLKRFGKICYGCCEPIDTRWDIIKGLPNLTRVSVSPWSNVNVMAEKLQKDYIFSRKPNPAHLCVGFDQEALQAELTSTLSAAKDCNLEFVMKDTHTVEFDKSRFGKWVKMARRAIDII